MAANKVLILGDSGTGKTTSVSTLDPKSTFIICPDEKELPFKGWKKNYKTSFSENGKLDLQNTNFYQTTDVNVVKLLLQKISDEMSHIKVVLLDTITNLMISEYMGRIKEKGLETQPSPFKTSLTAGSCLKTIVPFMHSNVAYSLVVTDKVW